MVATTHGPPGSGRPRLIRTQRSQTDGGTPGGLDEHPLPADRVFVIGSDPGSDVVLPESPASRVEIGRDERDEYMVVDPSDCATLDGRPANGLSLHAGTRLQIGDWEAVFQRHESSDHGRPFAGRQGGEGSHQLPQPPRKLDHDAPLHTVDPEGP